VLAVADRQRGLFDAAWCSGLLREDSICSLLAEHGDRVVRDEDFADLLLGASRPPLDPAELAGDAVHGGRTLRPRIVERLLARTALDVPCQEPRTYVYPPAPELDLPELQATCEGSPAFNGFYGHGIVNALRAVIRR
jgi:hypothetical protein